MAHLLSHPRVRNAVGSLSIRAHEKMADIDVAIQQTVIEFLVKDQTHDFSMCMVMSAWVPVVSDDG